MYEHRNAPLLSAQLFWRRMLRHGGAALLVVIVSLTIGTVGYHGLEPNMSWIDAFENASMILGGMGPVNTLTTDAAKLFASFFALYSGVAFLLIAGLLITPLAHRLLHHFHLERGEP